jgi:hypothetical protein
MPETEYYKEIYFSQLKSMRGPRSGTVSSEGLLAEKSMADGRHHMGESRSVLYQSLFLFL